MFSAAKKPRLLTADDVPRIKHDCIKAYGRDWWETVGIKEVFEQYGFIQDDVVKQMKRDNVQEAIAKSFGVKIK